MTPRVQNILCLLALLLPALYLFAPSLFQGQLLWGGDIESLEFALKTAARRSLAAGEWPLWMPELLGGMPGIAASNLIFLYPTELFVQLTGLPVELAFGLDATVQLFLSGLGMWLFLRALGLERGPALLGAMAFAWSGSQLSLYYAGHVNNSKAIAMIPWAFWGVYTGMQKNSWLAWALAGAALALQVLGMGLQVYAYTILALAGFAFWLAWAEGGQAAWRKAVLGLAVAALFNTLLSAPQLLPSLEYISHSWRKNFSYEDFISWSFHPKESLTWIVPGFFGWRNPTYVGAWPFALTTEYFGLLPWGLAVAAVIAAWKSKKGMVRFFVFLALTAFVIGLGKWTPLHYLFYKLPVYSGFRSWVRFLCLTTFAVSVLAAFGFQYFKNAENEKARRGLLAFAGSALLISLFCLLAAEGVSLSEAERLTKAGSSQAALKGTITASAWHAILLSFVLALLAWAWPKIKNRPMVFKLLLPALLVFHFVDMRDMHQRFIFHKDPASITTPPPYLKSIPAADSQVEPFRIFVLPRLWQQNRSIYYGYENLMGYHGVQMAGQYKMVEALQKKQLELLDMMNVRYIFTGQPFEVGSWKLLNQEGAYVYENTRALPRAWLVTQLRQVNDDDEAFRVMKEEAFDPRLVALVEKPLQLPLAPPLGSVEWIKRSPNAFELKVSNPAESLLVVSQSWYPGWKAEARAWDGGASLPLEVQRVNGNLQGVALGSGLWKVKFSFHSPRFTAGLYLFALGLLGLLGLAWRGRKAL